MGRTFIAWAPAVGLSAALFAGVMGFGGTEPLVLAAAQIMILGLGVSVLWTANRVEMRRRSKPPAVVPLLLVALVLLQMAPPPAPALQVVHATAGRAPDSTLATISVDPYQTGSHLLLLLTCVAGFYVTLAVCQRRSGKLYLVYALVGIGAFEAFYGLVQYLTGCQQIFAYVKLHNLQEATGTYVNPNHFAGLVEMILPFGLALALYRAGELGRNRAGVGRREWFGDVNLLRPLFWCFLTVVFFAALVFSRSRMGIISAAISATLMLGLVATRLFQRRTVLHLGLLFVSAGIWMAIWIGPEPVIRRFETLDHEYAGGGETRQAIWRDTVRLIGQRPLLGSGYGTFSIAYTPVQTAFPNAIVNSAHNDYLEITSDLGLPAGLLLVGFTFLSLAEITRRCVAPGEDRFDQAIALGCVGSIAAILLHSLGDFNLYVPANAMLFSCVWGVAYSTPC